MHNYKQVNEFDAYPGGRMDDNSDQEEEEEEDFIQQQIRGQRLQMQEQDAGLEMLGQSAQRLGQLSLGISEELGHQNKWVVSPIIRKVRLFFHWELEVLGL